MIAIVDYGVGNLGSIANMLRKIGVEASITGDASAIERADKLILPGVGAFDAGIRNLRERGLVDVLDDQVVRRGKRVLGICLGMQLMTQGSAEGTERGLGWVEGSAHRFEFAQPEMLKVPHMGWSSVELARPSPLLEGLPDPARFYFVHSYYVRCAQPKDVLFRARHGVSFDAGFERGNVMGVQFHPEKSHRFGMSLLAGFARS
jgi:imidazole glycerol-phosphate synthase subunit HisH